MTKLQTIARNSYARAGAIASVGLLALPAFAQSTDPFDTALSTITTRVSGYGAALVGLSAVAVVFYVAMKFVKKIPKAA